MLLAAATALIAMAPAAVFAGETQTYQYDAQGQLVKVTSTDGRVTKYEYDAAGNRTKVEATPPARKVMVLPLIGGLVIPVNG